MGVTAPPGGTPPGSGEIGGGAVGEQSDATDTGDRAVIVAQGERNNEVPSRIEEIDREDEDEEGEEEEISKDALLNFIRR